MLQVSNSRRMFTMLIFGTLMVLAYVHAQVSILQVSYSIGKKEKAIARLTDEYKREKFYLARLTSPSFLHQALKERQLNLTTPKKVEVVRVIRSTQAPSLTDVLPVKPTVSPWFGFVREAQAKTTSKSE